jgi:hypothetical protein
LVAVFLLIGCNLKRLAPPVPLETPAAQVTAVPSPSDPEATEPVNQVKAPSHTLVLVLDHTDRLIRMSSQDLAREIARLSDLEEVSVENPLLLAAALAQTRQPVDTARALGLLQRVLGNSTAAAQAMHPLARLMESRLLQQRRLEEQLEKQTQQLRDAQRRNEQLNERLEAVRAIERSLTTRPAAPPASPPPQRPAP